MTASQQPDAEHAPLTSPAAAGSGPTGHDKAVEWLAGVLYGENPDVDRGSAVHWMLASHQSRVALAALRAALAAGDPAAAEALGLRGQWNATDSTSIELDQKPNIDGWPTREQAEALFVHDGDDALLVRFVTDWTEA